MRYPKAGDLQRATGVEITSNPGPKQNPWEVHSDSGLEGVFADEDDARFFAEEIRGGGASGIRVERRMRQRAAAARANPPSGRWAGASRTVTNLAQSLEVQSVAGLNMLLKYVPVEVAGVGYGWLFKIMPDGHDVVVELDGDGMQTFAASQVTPVAGRVPESPTQLALRAKYKAEDEEERRERGNPARRNPLAPSWRSVAGIGGNWNVEMQDKYGTWKVTDWDVSREYAEGRVAWAESKGGRARAVQGNPIEMHGNPARVTRERYSDSADIVIEHNRYGYTGWLESKRGGGRRPISFGATRPTNAQEALALAKKFLAGVHGRNNPAGLTAKGERMYESIKTGYGRDPRAAEIASRTVLARARTTKGLKK